MANNIKKKEEPARSSVAHLLVFRGKIKIKNSKLCNVVDYPKQFRVRFFDLIFIYLFSRENNMTARASVELLISVQLV
jgi:hypothetical protein